VADHFSLDMLGGFTVFKNDEPLVLPPACAKVVALAALKRRPLHRHWVCTVLWPDSAPPKAVGSLRSALWRLRPLGADALLTVDARSVGLAADVAVDWHDAVGLIDRLLTTGAPPGSDPELIATLLPLLRSGDLLQGWTHGWITAERRRYRSLRAGALDALGRGPERHLGHHGSAGPRNARHRGTSVPRGCDDTGQ
jgi:DNA-binding SARP family transcriptional activator